MRLSVRLWLVAWDWERQSRLGSANLGLKKGEFEFLGTPAFELPSDVLIMGAFDGTFNELRSPIGCRSGVY